MAINVTSDLVDISSADSTTTGGTFYRLNGTSSSNPLAEPDAKKQGASSIGFKCGATTGTTDTGGHFNAAATFNATGQHIFHWRNVVTPGNMLVKASRGCAVGLTNTSTTSTTAWSTTNYKLWFLDGSDTDTDGGWKCYVVDPAGTADVSAGTLTVSTIRNIGFITRQTSGVNTALTNVIVDAIRRGTGLTATTTAGTDTINFAALYSVDSTLTNAWGIITQAAGVYYGAAKMTIGSSSQTNVCNFSDTDQVLVWRKYPVSATLYEFNLLGSASFKTTMTLDGCVVRGQNQQTWNITCDANSDFKALGCSFANIRLATLSSGSLLSGCAIGQSGTITTNGAQIASCDFALQTATQLVVANSTQMSNISDCTFASGGTGHAIQLNATGTYSFIGLEFSGYAATNGSTGNEAVFVNVASGSVTINVSGGNSPSIRTAGATVTVVLGATVTFTGLPLGTDIVILTAGTTTILEQVDQHTSTSFAWSYSGTPTVDVGFIKPGFVPYYIRGLSLGTTDSSIPVAMSADRNYV